MVRLKDIYSGLIYDYDEISIPYGAIKSLLAIMHFYIVILISIPYGAIKSLLRSYRMLRSRPFQFLMVRLKACNISLFILIFIDFNSLWCD